MDARGAVCATPKGDATFSSLASRYWKSGRFAARYFTLRDWRERGLVARSPDALSYGAIQKAKKYTRSKASLPRGKGLCGTFFKSDLLTISEDGDMGKALYERWWFGQYGSYKAAGRGRLNKLDIYETIFLMSKGVLKLQNATRKDVLRFARSRRKDFDRMYGVYADWRSKGYVVKTGFKFGTHFRLYFPGTRPAGSGENSKEWVHSRHVIHVFPRESKLLISEWARAIRVAHSVRKTFILAVPGIHGSARTRVDYVLYHRKGGDTQNPSNSKPRYAMLSLGEEEYIGGGEFATAISAARSLGLEPVLAIADRETAVTYYVVREIKLAGSRNNYYEIDWMQP